MTTYVIWWTNRSDCELLLAIGEAETDAPSDEQWLVPDGWPVWLGAQFLARTGRPGLGRLWNNWPDALPNGIEPWPANRMARLLGGNGDYEAQGDRHSAGGIVVPLEDLHYVIGLPGLVTNDSLTRLLVHGVDIDL